MRIATWNINSVRVRLDRLLRWLEEDAPDVVCLQETKVTDEQFPRLEIEAAGYSVEVFGQKTYNGVAILAREDLTDVERGLPGWNEDADARVIAADAGEVRVVNLYVPNGKEVGHEAYAAKLRWLDRLAAYVDDHSPQEPLVVCGDFNIAPEAIDVYDPDRWEGKNLFSMPERERFRKLLDWGLVDSLRAARPAEQVFSWWDYRRGQFWRNQGLRIDHLLVTRPLADRIERVDVVRDLRKGEKPSDHAPVMLELED